MCAGENELGKNFVLALTSVGLATAEALVSPRPEHC